MIIPVIFDNVFKYKIIKMSLSVLYAAGRVFLTGQHANRKRGAIQRTGLMMQHGY
jgi:hypothetical protein